MNKNYIYILIMMVMKYLNKKKFFPEGVSAHSIIFSNIRNPITNSAVIITNTFINDHNKYIITIIIKIYI